VLRDYLAAPVHLSVVTKTCGGKEKFFLVRRNIMLVATEVVGMKILHTLNSRLSPFSAWWPIPLRLIVGYGFMEHGYAKLARGADSFVLILQALHMPLAPLLAWATILTELIGGFAILIGAFVPLASVPMAIVLLVAIVTVHLPNGFSSIKLQAVTGAGAHFGQPGYETDLLYLACLAALVLGGAGPLSVDTFLIRRGQTQLH
jgi:putative oxidoreductase